MRNAIRHLCGADAPDHLGLAYSRYARIDVDTGKVPDDDRARWLNKLAETTVSDDYPAFFETWRRSLEDDGVRTEKARSTSRLLIGHGNAAPTDVGLTLHHTWGVPVIPGSALKGLLSHYIDAVYGSDSDLHPLDSAHPEPDRAPFRGVTWRDRQILHGPGHAYRALFGAPDAESDRHYAAGDPVGAVKGSLVFYDALLEPSLITSEIVAPDVLTPHQRSYYDALHKGQVPPWPNDYDDPVPVAFLTARPHLKFLIAIAGPEELVDFAFAELAHALSDWGVGAKTAAGYGRLKVELTEPSQRTWHRGLPLSY